MTWYREIDPQQEPHDLTVDDVGRARCGFNIYAIKDGVGDFTAEIVKRLEDATVGTYETDIFISSRHTVPTGDGPYLSLIETGGTGPERTHNTIFPPAYKRPSLLLVVRARTYEAAETMAKAAYNALIVRNQDITP